VERMLPREIEGIIKEDTGMKLQRANTRVLLGKLRTAHDDVFELACGAIKRVLVAPSRWRGGDGCPVATDEYY
jgi:hypothetical protein